MIDLLKRHNLFNDIQRRVNNLAEHAESLIYYSSTNVCESVNGVIAKCITGKRINYAQRRSFHTRCSSAIASFNTSGELQRQAHKAMMNGESPGK
jgi:hypothetical protein